MVSTFLALWWALSPAALPLLAIGLILWSCESSWQRPLGNMGSVWFLGIGAVLCLPMALYFIPAVLENLFR
jgi:hypothetical protein